MSAEGRTGPDDTRKLLWEEHEKEIERIAERRRALFAVIALYADREAIRPETPEPGTPSFAGDLMTAAQSLLSRRLPGVFREAPDRPDFDAEENLLHAIAAMALSELEALPARRDAARAAEQECFECGALLDENDQHICE